MDAGFSVVPLASTVPLSESSTPSAGIGGTAARDDHVHQRLSSATWATLNGSNEAAVTFTRLFATKPVVNCVYEESADNQPIIFKVKSWVQDGSNNYTGVVVKGYRLNTLPATITLFSQLVNFSVSSGSATGVTFACLAVAPSA